MRWGIAAFVLLLVAGCGSAKPDTRAASPGHNALVVRAPERAGRWAKLLLSPDGSTYLGQWSGECEVQQTYFVPARGGTPRPVTGHRGDESVALGWASHNRARILVPRALCGRQFGKPGIYVVDRDGRAVLVRAVNPRPGGA